MYTPSPGHRFAKLRVMVQLFWAQDRSPEKPESWPKPEETAHRHQDNTKQTNEAEKQDAGESFS